MPFYAFNMSAMVHSEVYTLPMGKQAAMGAIKGLEYLHYHHILHLDLKPENIMVPHF